MSGNSKPIIDVKAPPRMKSRATLRMRVSYFTGGENRGTYKAIMINAVNPEMERPKVMNAGTVPVNPYNADTSFARSIIRDLRWTFTIKAAMVARIKTTDSSVVLRPLNTV